MTTAIRTYRHRVLSTSVAAVGLAVALALLPGTQPAAEASTPADVKTHAARADSAITRAVQRIQAQEYGQARKALDNAAGHIRKANVQAVSLIGAPPTDPESDDPPGPPAVLTALRLDNRVAIRVAPLFDGMTRPRLLEGLHAAIRVAQVRRIAVLDRVLALPAEGDGADYADGLADTLPSYAREVAAFSDALDTFSLTADARSALTTAHDRAAEAEARMNSAYGGGERPTR